MQSDSLIETLAEQTRQVMNQVEKLKAEDLHTLTWRPDSKSWSILECVEHLNLYGDFYLPEIEKSIRNSVTKEEVEFKSGVLGNYFAKSMMPKENLNKMKTFKDKNPLNARLEKTVIDRFLSQQLKLVDLLHQSRKVSLNQVRIKTSISGLLKLKLGDTFRFIINHNLRHLKQIERIQEHVKLSAVR